MTNMLRKERLCNNVSPAPGYKSSHQGKSIADKGRISGAWRASLITSFEIFMISLKTALSYGDQLLLGLHA
jgi:hypothetical protein